MPNAPHVPTTVSVVYLVYVCQLCSTADTAALKAVVLVQLQAAHTHRSQLWAAKVADAYLHMNAMMHAVTACAKLLSVRIPGQHQWAGSNTI
jgi:hypothetical protein